MAKLLETVYLESASGVDAESGVLRGVKLLGMESRNKRRYKREGMQKAVSLYEGLKIYVDHPSRDDAGGERKMKDWAGVITKARFESDGIYGDVKLRKESEHFRGIIEAATEFPKAVGFSHVADGESDYEGDTEIVESIKKVFSVDLVTDPATTGGFFESKRPTTVKTAVESLPESPVRKRLVEMMGAGLLDGGLPMDDQPADPLASLCQELIRMLGDTLKALASKEPVTVTPPAPPAPEEDMDKEQQAAFESLKQEHATIKEAHDKLLAENAKLVAQVLLLESGREATPVRVKALAEAAEADRKPLLESWPITESVERPLRSPGLLESEAADLDYEFADGEKFAARYR